MAGEKDKARRPPRVLPFSEAKCPGPWKNALLKLCVKFVSTGPGWWLHGIRKRDFFLKNNIISIYYIVSFELSVRIDKKKNYGYFSNAALIML